MAVEALKDLAMGKLKVRSVSILAEAGSSDHIRIASRILIQQTKSTSAELGRNKKDDLSDHSERVSLTQKVLNFNPCFCFRCCCYGNFTLRTGCYIVAVCSSLYGLFSIISAAVLSQLTFEYYYKTACEPEEFRDLRLTRAFIFKENGTLVLALLIIRGIFFEICPGIVIAFAARNLDYSLCFFFIVLMMTEIAGSFIVMGVFTDYILTASIAQVEIDFRRSFITWLWGIFFVALFIRTYFIVCGVCLYRQIRSGEYTNVERIVPVSD